MSWKDEWATVKADMERDHLDEKTRKAVTRNFFLKTVAPRAGGRRTPGAEAFIQQNIIKKPAPAKPRQGGGYQAAAEGFNRNLTGQVLGATRKAVTGEKYKPVGIKGEDNVIAPGFMSVVKEGATSTLGELADPIGLALDAFTGKVGGKLASKGMKRALAVGGAAVTSGAVSGAGQAAAQGYNQGHIDPRDVARTAVQGAALSGLIGGLTSVHRAPIANVEDIGPRVQTHGVAPDHRNQIAPPRPRRITEAPAPSGHSTVTVHPEVIGQRNRLNAGPQPSHPIQQPGRTSAPLALPEPIEDRARRILSERGHTPDQVEAIINNAKTKRPQLFLPEQTAIEVPPGGFKPAVAGQDATNKALYNQIGERPAGSFTPEIHEGKVFTHPDGSGAGWRDHGQRLHARQQLEAQNPGWNFEDVGMGKFSRTGGYENWGLKATRKAEPPVTTKTVPAATTPPRTPQEEAERLYTTIDQLEEWIGNAQNNPIKNKDQIAQAMAAREEAMAKLNSLNQSAGEGEQSRPFSTEQKPNLFSDESGQATMGAALNPVGNVVKGASKGAATIDRLADHILRKAIGKVTETAANGINKAAGREVVHGGLDSVTGEDRMGQDLADAYDFIRRDAGKGTPALDWYRQRFMNDYGLDPAFVEKRNASQHTRRMIQQEGKAIADTLRGKLTAEQEARLYEILNDRAATNTEMSGTSEPVRQRVNELSQEMRDVGSLTDNQYNANAGQYLKRSYEKHLSEMPAISQWTKGFSKSMKGSKFRGKKETLSPQQLEIRNQGWKEVSQEPDGRLRLSNGTKEILVSQKKAGDFLGNWSQLGTPGGGGKVTAWRDWTPSERATMGEHRVASDAVEATFNQAARDLPNGALLRDVSKNPAWAVKAGEGVEPPDGWIHLGNEKHSGGADKWGALADHWVEPNIARDLQAAKSAAENHREWKAMIAEWKKNKTSRNVKSHVNNAVQNVITLEMNGGSVRDLSEALNALRNQDGLYKELNEAGLFDGNFSHTELANAIEWHGDSPIRIAQSVGNAVAKLDKKMGEAYGSADDIFRVAYVIGKTKEGVPVQEAVRQAKTRLYHAGVTAPWVRSMGQYGVIPFVSQIHWAAAEVPKMILRNPGKVAKIGMYVGLYKMMTNYFNKESREEQDAKQTLLPDYQKGPFNTLPIPGRDSKGQELILNTKNWNPGGTFDVSERTALPGWPSSLMPGGPLAMPFNLLLNRDGLMMRDITKKKDFMGKLGDVIPWTVDQLGPTTTAHDVGNLINAARGRADASGRRYDVPTALANVAGVKIQPFDPEQAYRKLQGRYAAELSQIQGDIYAANRKRQQNIISEQEFQNVMQQKRAEYQALAKEQQQELRKAQPAIK